MHIDDIEMIFIRYTSENQTDQHIQSRLKYPLIVYTCMNKVLSLQCSVFSPIYKRQSNISCLAFKQKLMGLWILYLNHNP